MELGFEKQFHVMSMSEVLFVKRRNKVSKHLFIFYVQEINEDRDRHMDKEKERKTTIERE